MSEHKNTECLEFQELFTKPVITKFDEKHGSSDGGALLLKAADRNLCLIENLSKSILDKRNQDMIEHKLEELLSLRIFGIGCGYSDANDVSRLSQDPVHKLIAGRDPVKGKDLASQPTISRLENNATWKDLYRMSISLMQAVIGRHQKRLKGKAKLITIDLDPTDDPTHGKQQLTFFNTYYDTYCYMPILGFVTFNNETEQYLFNATLRPGNADAKLGAIGILRRVIAQLKMAFPNTKIRVRLDGGFASPEIYEFLEYESVEYVVNMAKNSILKENVEKKMIEVRAMSKKSGHTEKKYTECKYAARSWKNIERRIIVKAEVVQNADRKAKDNPRFVVTNMKQTPKYIYEKIYCKRGDAENRIKELLYGLALGRTSCTKFKANQMRVLFSAAAFILFQEIRLAAKGSKAEKLQVTTMMPHLIKIGARVVESVRRVVIHLPQSFPFIEEYKYIAQSLNTSTA